MGKKPHKTRRIHADCSCTNVRMKSDVPLRLGFASSKLWKPNKTRSCEKEAIQNLERIELRMKSDVPLRFGFVLSELWKPNKTRSCGKEAIQNLERIELRMKSDVPLRFGFVLSELWKPNKTRSCGKEAIQNQEIIKCDPVCEKGSYSLSNCIYMVTHNLTGEYGTSLQFGHSTTLTWQ